MRFTRVAGRSFRIFETFEFAPEPGINLLVGPNASGKTTLLEALYALGHGRGFRGAAAELAGAAGEWMVHGRIQKPDSSANALGVAWSPAGLRIRVDETDATLQDLVSVAPVQLLQPDSHRLLEDGPTYRRQFLDWGVFHVEHRFLPAWRSFQRALHQRNQALRMGSDRTAVEAWNEEFANSAEEIQRHRAQHVQSLLAPLGQQIDELLGRAEWALELSPGWSTALPLVETLRAHYENDRRQRTTLVGPHRAELKLRFAGRSAKHHASRGQQKLLIAALLLAQAEVVRSAIGHAPVLLIDDFPAELGHEFQRGLLGALRRYLGQSFVTSIERTPALETVSADALFHVEHGSISAPSRV